MQLFKFEFEFSTCARRFIKQQTMVLRIRLITKSDAGGIYVRDVPILDLWRRLPGEPLVAFHRHVCDLLATEGVSLHQLEKCTMLSMWYVSGPDNVVHDLSDPYKVPDNSLVCFDTLSSRLMRTYTNPKSIHVYDMDPIENNNVLITHSQSSVIVTVQGGNTFSVPVLCELHSGLTLLYIFTFLQQAGALLSNPTAFVTNDAWRGKMQPFTGRHQLQGNNRLHITCGEHPPVVTPG